MKKISYLLLALILTTVCSCKNQEWAFPDFEYSTVYFAYQYPVRTITLGEDIYDTSMDNAHKCSILATMGGVYSNKNDVTIDIKVDNELCQNLHFDGQTQKVLPMPSNYYKLSSNQIKIDQGKITGGVEVQLTDAFFLDSLAIRQAYVIPLVMTNVSNADSILGGKSLITSPRRAVGGDWDVLPKDYVLYAIKFINPWHATYLRRGKDIIQGKQGNSTLNKTIVRHQEYVEKDEICNLTTRSLKEAVYSGSIKDANGKDLTYQLVLKFDDSGNCQVVGESDQYIVKGSGKFVKKGDLKSWGNQDRDVLHLAYEVDFKTAHLATTDTLVVRNRGVVMETFLPRVN